MAVPYSDVLNVFHACFQSPTVLSDTLEKQFFIAALADFELDLYIINYDDVNESIEDDLSRSEVNLLGKLMYKEYLSREKDRILKLNNIVGRDIKLTSMGDSKRTIIEACKIISDETEEMINKLKGSSFYD